MSQAAVVIITAFSVMHPLRRAVEKAVWHSGAIPRSAVAGDVLPDEAVAVVILAAGEIGASAPGEVAAAGLESAYRQMRAAALPVLVCTPPSPPESEPLIQQAAADATLHQLPATDDPGAGVYAWLMALPALQTGAAPALDDIPPRPVYYMTGSHSQPTIFQGREGELAALDAWADSGDALLVVEGPGGTGKTCLVWHWMHRRQWPGVIWWNFYARRSSLNMLVTDGLAYLTGQPISAFENIGYKRQELLFLEALSQEPVLLVLDGVERLMNAYLNPGADDLHDRTFSDPRVGTFLRRLLEITPAKVLVTSRLLPGELHGRGQRMLAGGRHLHLDGLTPIDTLRLLERLGVHGDAGRMQAFTSTFRYHSLLVRLVAGMVRVDAGGDFDTWESRLHDAAATESDISLDADITPAASMMGRRQAELLMFALRLPVEQVALLNQMALYRYPVTGQELRAFNPFTGPDALTRFYNLLRILEQRGLLRFAGQEYRYDSHPVIRAYLLDDFQQQPSSLRDHFITRHDDYLDAVSTMGDLQPVIAVYRALLAARLPDEAAVFYTAHLGDVLRLRLGAYGVIVELLEPLFTDGFSHLPPLKNAVEQANILHFLADALYRTGQLSDALALRELSLQIEIENASFNNIGVDLLKYAELLDLSGELAAAIHAADLARRVGEIASERNVLAWASLLRLHLYAHAGDWSAAQAAYEAFTTAPPTRDLTLYQLRADIYHTRTRFFMRQNVRKEWKEILQRAVKRRSLPEQLLTLHYQGDNALVNRNSSLALQCFLEAIKLAEQTGSLWRAVLQGGLARAYVQRNQMALALRTIDAALAEKGYDGHGDLYNSAAEVFLAAEDDEKAAYYASRAFEQAYGDGPPYVYLWNLERAQRLLASMNIPEPDLPDYAQARRRPLPGEEAIIHLLDQLTQYGAESL